MRNLAPTALTALPHVRSLAELEQAFNSRRAALGATVTAAALVGTLVVQQPSMAWTTGPRTQPRDGRGRFLSSAWLERAETFTAADLAWFRSPITR